jgi:glycosyltransferase involved in cell wall biosynthesis
MTRDVPVVVLDTEVAREIYGDAARYVATPDPALIASALDEALFDDAARVRLRTAGRTAVARYSWTACAARTLTTLVSSATR